MPLVRVKVRNEYGLGAEELFGGADKDDPKAVLEGVAVAGLVGILRQLGDLAEFAAEVFHDLQEQVMVTAARSHKMIVRVQRIEAALPPLEKAVMDQKSHLHFAYVAGSVWHPNIRTKRNHFIHSDLPRFIMNSYEECLDPPRFHLLDKFDTGGPGACLRRYSDPSFFKKALAGSDTLSADKVQREKASKIKKKGSRRRNSSISWNSGRMPFTASNSFGQSSAAESISTFHTRSKSEVIDRSLSFDMRTRSSYIECVFGASSTMQHGDREHRKLPTSGLKMQHSGTDGFARNDERRIGADDNPTLPSLQKQNAPSVTWDEKTEITKPKSQLSDNTADDETEAQSLPMNSDFRCVSGASPSMQPADQEHKQFSALSLKAQHNGLGGSIGKDEQRTDVIDNLTHGSLRELSIPSFSSVTWDEKIEIMEPKCQQPHKILEGENEVQLLPTSSAIKCVSSARPMEQGDHEHTDISVSSLIMQHKGANGCLHHDEQKIGAIENEVQLLPTSSDINCVSSASPMEHGGHDHTYISESSLTMQHKGANGCIHRDEQKIGAIEYEAQLLPTSSDIKCVSSASPMDHGDHEHTDISASSLTMQHKGANGCIHHDEQKMGAIENEAQLLPTSSDIKCVSSASPVEHGDHELRDISASSLTMQHKGANGCIHRDEQKIGAIENDAQLLPTTSAIKFVSIASPIEPGDHEDTNISASSPNMQHKGANGCIHRDEQKIGAIDCFTHGSLQEQNSPNFSLDTRDELSTSSLKMQHIGGDGPTHHDKQKNDAIDNLAYDSQKELNIPQFSSFNWSERIRKTEPNSQQRQNFVVGQSEGRLLPKSLEIVKLGKEATMNGIADITDMLWVDQNVPDLPVEDDQSEGQLLPKSLEIVKLGKEATMNGIVDINDMLWVDENVPDLPVEDDQFDDEAGSETDKYVDALNTLESESETDTECQTEREVEKPLANVKNEGMKSGQNEDTQNSEESNFGFVTTTHSSSNKFSKLNSSEDLVLAQEPDVTGVLSNPDISVVNDLSGCMGDLDISGVHDFDSVIKAPSSSGSSIADSQAQLDTELLSSFSGFQNPYEIFTSPSLVWTNGGLLGLEPSKPPDFSVPPLVSDNSKACNEDDSNDHSSCSLMDKSYPNGSVTKLDMLVKVPGQMEKNPSSNGEDRSIDTAYLDPLKNDTAYLDCSGQLVRRVMNMDQAIDHSECSTTYYDKQDDEMSKKKCLKPLSAFTEARLKKSEDSCQSSSFNSVHENGLVEASPMIPVAEPPSVHEIKDSSSEACQDSIKNSSSNFRHGVANGFPRNGSLLNGAYEPASFMKTGLMKLNEPNGIGQEGKDGMEDMVSSVRNPKGNLENGSPVNSRVSSPPLEHMKISFHPIDGFNTSKLKLKFPGGHHFHESIKDVMFPSFHLLPEPAIMDIDSESDDDTFCRSSPCMSDEAMSYQSESSSEQWEPGEISGYNNNEIYDSLRRISSDESISSAFELCGIGNHSIHFDNCFEDQDGVNSLGTVHHNSLFDLPTLDSVDPFMNQQERTCSSDLQNYTDTVSQLPNEPAPPPPPPLPPVQWWVTKSNFDSLGDEKGSISDGPRCLNDQVQQAALTPEPKSASLEQLLTGAVCLTNSQDPQANRLREANQAVNAKEIDEREDLLLQIRTKSFSLRRTTPARAPSPKAPETITKVAAMLEKAYAIRQAYVGSDEGGGDESWSDG